MNKNLEVTIEELFLLVKNIGKYQLEMFRNDSLLKYTKERVSDLVTEVDQKSERLIKEYIETYHPQDNILAEESGDNNKESDYRWVIDPLDGTNNYASGIPIFCISIALQYKEETILGVVYAPYLNELFWAIKDSGAYLNGEKISVSLDKKLEECIVATGFPYDKSLPLKEALQNFEMTTPHFRGVRRIGAAAYDMCLVALGAIDVYYEIAVKLWDIAAGCLIVKEAGGITSNITTNYPIGIIAGSKEKALKIKDIIE